MQHVEAHRQPQRSARDAQLAQLTQVNLDDLLGGIGLQHIKFGRRALELLAAPAARRFSHAMIAYDDLVGVEGLAVGGAWITQRFAAGLDVAGAPPPRTGPALFVSNHPGLCDTGALFAAIDRPDLLIIAAERPFLRALPHTARALLFVDEAGPGRGHALRSAARHLRGGGAVLTFPAGRIEPDPALLPGAAAALDGWSSSFDLLARFVPELTVLPVIVSGVISRRALRHPLTYLRRKPADRQWLAALLQLQLRSLQRQRVRVAFGNPLRLAELAPSAPLSAAIRDEARRLLAAVPRA